MWFVVAIVHASVVTSVLLLLCGGKSPPKSKSAIHRTKTAEKMGTKTKTCEGKSLTSSPIEDYKDKAKPIPPSADLLNMQTAKPSDPVENGPTEQQKDPQKGKNEKVEEPVKSDDKAKKKEEPKTASSENKTEGDKKEEQKTKDTEGDQETPSEETICDIKKLKKLGSLDLKVSQDVGALNREIPSQHEESTPAEAHGNKMARHVVIKDEECKIYETDDVETIDDDAETPNVEL